MDYDSSGSNPGVGEWECYYDPETLRYFYYNQNSGCSSWNTPTNDNWVRCFDYDSNSVYYYNDDTHESVWELPDGATLLE